MAGRWTTAVLASLLALPVAPALPRSLPPRDECLAIEGYFAFRQELEAIVKARDAKRLLAITADDLSWSFGGGYGKAEFAAEWKLDGDGAKSEIWAEFDKMLPLGCGIDESRVVFPYLFAADVSDQPENLAIMLVLGNGINLRAEPKAASASLARLSWELVQSVEGEVPGDWTKVKTAAGKSGWVRSDYLRSDIDYRAGFERREGKWVLTYFIAGD